MFRDVQKLRALVAEHSEEIKSERYFSFVGLWYCASLMGNCPSQIGNLMREFTTNIVSSSSRKARIIMLITKQYSS